MLLIVSLFLICVVVMPPAGEALRHRQRAILQRKRLDAFLRDSPVADYHLN
jgi:hypothetical protein